MTRECTDEFLKWLGFANAGMLHPGNVIARLLVDEGRRNALITCDKWAFEGAENGGPIGGSEISHGDYREFVKSTFKRNVEFFSRVRRPHTVELTSDEFFDAWERRVGVRDVFGGSLVLGVQIQLLLHRR
jgi:hypothetical protein